MSIVEEFKKLFLEAEEKEVIEFVKNLSDGEKIGLIIKISEIRNYFYLSRDRYYEHFFKQKDKTFKDFYNTDFYKKFEERETLFDVIEFICFKEDRYNFGVLEKLYEYNIFDSYFPEYLYQDDYIFQNSYFVQLECKKRNYKIATKEEIVNALRLLSDISWDKVLPITLKTHIWYFFEYECDIEYTKWNETIKSLVDNNLIPRDKVIEGCLSLSLKFQKRGVLSYFFKLLESLTLTNEEILVYQETLFSVLSSQHSKPITQTLKYIKQIHKEKSFKLTEFSSHIPTLLSWNIKSLLNSTLSLIDALIKAYPKERENLALLSLEVLASEDENIQIKLLKILKKHKLLDNQTILDEINIYAEGLYNASKELLPNMEETEIEESFEIIPPQFIREDNKIPTYESFDDLVFFFAQVFEGKNTYDFDLFLLLLPKLHAGVNIHNVYKLSPLFLLAEKSYKKHDTSEDSNVLSHIISLMALTFIKYILRYQVIFHQDLQSLHEKHPYFKEKIEMSVIFKAEEEERYKEATTIYSTLLLDMLDKLSHPRVILSTPTHTPCWIDIDILIERLKTYQLSSMTIEAYDIQIALARVVINNVNIQKIKNDLSGEIRDVLLYLCTDKSLVIAQIKNPHYWITPILRKNNSLDAEVFTQKFSKKISLDLLSPPAWKVHIKELNYLELTLNKSIIYLKFISLFKRINQRPNALGSKYDSISLLFLTPTLTHFTLENELLFTYYDRDIFSVKAFIGLIPALSKIWDYPNQTSYLFLAYVFIHHHKTIRTLSAELWIKATTEGTMNHQLLGETLGKLEHNEYAPLKRFTDLIVANMLNISSLHNRGLETLLSSMIKQMNDEPIKGTKKLLEIYLEVLSLTKQKPSSEVLEKLSVWGEVNSLKVIVKKIILI